MNTEYDHTPHEIHVEEPFDIFQWLQDNSDIVNHHSVALIEKMLYDDVQGKLIVVKLIDCHDQRVSLTISRDEIDVTLDTIFDWAIKEEEYEICARIKYLREKL